MTQKHRALVVEWETLSIVCVHALVQWCGYCSCVGYHTRHFQRNARRAYLYWNQGCRSRGEL